MPEPMTFQPGDRGFYPSLPDSTLPMMVVGEVWPVAADKRGIWLLSDVGPWPTPPIPGASDPHTAAEVELIQHQAFGTTKLLHSTSWRVDYSEELGNTVVLTYMAVVACSDAVREEWPEARPVSTRVAEVVGGAPTHGPVEPPTVRHWDVLLHGLRHIAFLRDTDATVAAVLSEDWLEHLAAFKPAIARMYSEVHEVA